MLLENEIACIIGKLSKEKPGTTIYKELDNRYQILIKQKIDFVKMLEKID